MQTVTSTVDSAKGRIFEARSLDGLSPSEVGEIVMEYVNGGWKVSVGSENLGPFPYLSAQKRL